MEAPASKQEFFLAQAEWAGELPISFPKLRNPGNIGGLLPTGSGPVWAAAQEPERLRLGRRALSARSRYQVSFDNDSKRPA
jgi:hypothetical protein